MLAIFENHAVVDVFARAAEIFFFIWGLVALVIGIGMIVRSARLYKFLALMNTYVSTRRALRVLSVPRHFGASIVKHRVWFGTLFALAAAYALFNLILEFDTARVVSVVGTNLPRLEVEMLVESIRWFLAVCNGLAFVVGILLIFFPNAFNAVEARADHWYSLRRLTMGVDTMRLPLDRWVGTFPRAAGWMIVVGALAVVIEFGLPLFYA